MSQSLRLKSPLKAKSWQQVDSEEKPPLESSMSSSTGNSASETLTNCANSIMIPAKAEDAVGEKDEEKGVGEEEDTSCGLCGFPLNWFKWCRTPNWVLFW